MLATPLQLASATAALAMRGQRYQPRLVAATEDPLTGERTLTRPVPLADVGIDNEFYWDSIIAAMNDVLQGHEIEERLRDHALFIAFAPLEDPQIAVAVVIENGSSGSRVAAPVARAIMDRYLGVDSDAI